MYQNQDENSNIKQVLQKVKKNIKRKQDFKNDKVMTKTKYTFVVTIPPQFTTKQFFRTDFEIILSTDTNVSSDLGELCINIFTIGYKIISIDFIQDKNIFHLAQRDFQLVDIGFILKFLEYVNLQNSKISLEKFIKEHKNQEFRLCSQDEIQQIDSYAQKYPYECYLIRYNTNGSKVLQYIHNLKYLQLMGITLQMMDQHFKETNILPCAIKVYSYLDVWNKMFTAVAQQQNIFTMEIQNYNGIKQYIQLEQQIRYFKYENDENVYCYLYWIYLTNPDPQIAEMNQQQVLEASNPKPKRCNYKALTY